MHTALSPAGSRTADRPAARPHLEIALANNMPDTALHATERQFASLLAEAAGNAFDIGFRLYALPSVPRGELALATIQERYASVDALEAAGADALIVTGCEPRAPDLRDEPYWSELTGLIDWARGATHSSLFSCLAAHAAVLHLDGLQRRRLPDKCSGVFVFARAADSALTRGMGQEVRTPHSRLNTVAAEDLADRGYQILTHSEDAGVDVFTRQEKSLFVFLQGHPEYEPDTLLREYRRDLGRFLRGERALPACPRGYFDAETEQTFQMLAARGRASEMLARCEPIAGRFQPAAPWRRQAVRLYRNWLERVAAMKSGVASGARPEADAATLLN